MLLNRRGKASPALIQRTLQSGQELAVQARAKIYSRVIVRVDVARRSVPLLLKRVACIPHLSRLSLLGLLFQHREREILRLQGCLNLRCLLNSQQF